MYSMNRNRKENMAQCEAPHICTEEARQRHGPETLYGLATNHRRSLARHVDCTGEAAGPAG